MPAFGGMPYDGMLASGSKIKPLQTMLWNREVDTWHWTRECKGARVEMMKGSWSKAAFGEGGAEPPQAHMLAAHAT